MRLLFIVLSLVVSSMASAEMMQLPEATLSAKSVGGAIVMIQMKHSLVINGDIHEKLVKELGADGRKNLIRDMIMDKEVAALKMAYTNLNRPAATQVVQQYERLVSPSAKLSLNAKD